MLREAARVPVSAPPLTSCETSGMWTRHTLLKLAVECLMTPFLTLR